jgi:hypothetical protein
MTVKQYVGRGGVFILSQFKTIFEIVDSAFIIEKVQKGKSPTLQV